MHAYWFSTCISTLTIVVLIICIAYTKIRIQTIVALHSLFNLWVMLISTLMLLSVHHHYGNLYPFHRNLPSDEVFCGIHSALSIVSRFIPSTSLVLLIAIHYRAVFWSRFDRKLERKQMGYFVVCIWITAMIVVILWTMLQGSIINWDCYHFMASNSFSWTSIISHLVCLICSITSFITFVTCYVKMILQVHKEEALVKSARSKKISTTRQIVVRFGFTFVLHASQISLMITMMVMSLIQGDDVIQVVIFAAYLVTVAITDVYMHAFVVLRKILKQYCIILLAKIRSVYDFVVTFRIII